MQIPVAIMWSAAAFQALGAISSANSQASALKAQAASANYNAEVSKQQATQALATSTAQQSALRRDQRAQAGRMRAAAAQSGVGFGGSTADIFEQSDTLSELDAMNVAYEGALKARGYNTQAELDSFNARAYSAQVKGVRRAGYMQAAGSLLTAGYMTRGAFGGGPTVQTRRSTVGGG